MSYILNDHLILVLQKPICFNSLQGSMLKELFKTSVLMQDIGYYKHWLDILTFIL